MIISSTPSLKNIALISSHPFWSNRLIVIILYFFNFNLHACLYFFIQYLVESPLVHSLYGMRGGCYEFSLLFLLGHLYLIDGCGLVGEDQRTTYCRLNSLLQNWHFYTCFKEIGVILFNLLTIVHSIGNTIGSSYVVSYGNQQTCTSDDHNQSKVRTFLNLIFVDASS